MRIHKPFALATASSIVLVACGGGGGSDSPQAVSSPTSPQTTARFTEIPNALRMANPYPNTITRAIALDVSGDGRDDLVFHQWEFNTENTRTGSAPCNNVLKVYVMQPDNTFVDQTTSYVQGDGDLKGCSRKLRTADLNGDNKLDLLLAMNNEDGRASDNVMLDFNTSNVALISDGALFKVQKFGKPFWYHAIGVGYDKNDKIFAAAAAFTGLDHTKHYFDNATPAQELLMQQGFSLSPSTFEFVSSKGKNKHTDLLIQGSNTFPNNTTVEGFVQDDDGVYRNIGAITFAPLASIVKGTTYWNSDTDLPVFKVDNYHIAFAGISESCVLKMSPDSNPIVVFSMDGRRVDNFQNTNLSENSLGPHVSIFKAVKIQEGKLEEVSLNIQNEVVQSNYIVHQCKDLNGDGYDDIVRYPLTNDGLPYVYLNDKNGGFKLYEFANFPNVTTGWENGTNNNATSILHDFDRDGFLDLLIYAHWNVRGRSSLTYKFYKGQRSL